MSVTVTAQSLPSYRQLIAAGNHTLFSDMKPAEGQSETAPEPYDLLLGAWGACTNMTIQLYATRKQWPLENVSTRLQKTTGEDGQILLRKTIQLWGPLSDEQVKRLKIIAEKCPINQLITHQGNPPRIESTLEALGSINMAPTQ